MVQTPQLSSGGATSEIYFKCVKGGEMRKEIQKQWDIIKKDIHSNTKVKGKEIHHIHGRIGILKCCAYNLAILTKKDLEDRKRVIDYIFSGSPYVIQVYGFVNINPEDKVGKGLSKKTIKRFVKGLTQTDILPTKVDNKIKQC